MTIRKVGLVFFAAVFLLQGCAKKGPGSVNVGVILPLTGPVAEPGNKALNGLRLAIEEFNRVSKEDHITLIIEDSQSDPRAGVSAANKLINVDHVRVIIGDLMSSVAMAVAPIAQENKVVLFAPGASNPKFPDLGDYIFRNWASDNYDGKVMAEYLVDDLKKTTSGVIYVNNDYGLGLATSFIKHFEELGGKVLIDESYPQGNTDFRSIIADVKAKKGIQILYLPGQPLENGYLVKQLVELGARIPIASNLSVESPEFLTVAKNGADGIIFTTPAYDPNFIDRNGISFKADYSKTYKSDPDVVAGTAFDAGNILIKALTMCNFNLEMLRDSLASIRNFPGVTGNTTFLPNGDVEKSVYVERMESKGQPSLIKTFVPK